VADIFLLILALPWVVFLFVAYARFHTKIKILPKIMCNRVYIIYLHIIMRKW